MRYRIMERWYGPRGSVQVMPHSKPYSIGAALKFIAKRRAQCTPFGFSDFWLVPL